MRQYYSTEQSIHEIGLALTNVVLNSLEAGCTQFSLTSQHKTSVVMMMIFILMIGVFRSSYASTLN